MLFFSQNIFSNMPKLSWNNSIALSWWYKSFWPLSWFHRIGETVISNEVLAVRFILTLFALWLKIYAYGFSASKAIGPFQTAPSCGCALQKCRAFCFWECWHGVFFNSRDLWSLGHISTKNSGSLFPGPHSWCSTNRLFLGYSMWCRKAFWWANKSGKYIKERTSSIRKE